MKVFNLSFTLKHLVIVSLGIILLTACESDDDNTFINENNIDQQVTETDIDALLFMIEEEKLARDTYDFLYDQWGISIFDNISNSEQSHMNALENLLINYNIDYDILPAGEFNDSDLQNFYNQFVDDGSQSLANSLQIGATIEDLDIVDLQQNIDETSNAQIIAVFESLKCGSRNHLRSFVNTIETNGNAYTPQFLNVEDYNTIIDGSHEQCNN